MQTKSWIPGEKEWNFIRQNLTIISPQEMADHFNVTLSVLNQEKLEAGIVIDDYTAEKISTAEYALDRWLNRWERALQWSIDQGLLNCCKGFCDRRIA